MATHPPPLTSQELEDTLRPCRTPGHGDEPIVISGKCHPNAPLIVTYDLALVGLWLICAVCKTAVTCVAVKPSEVH